MDKSQIIHDLAVAAATISVSHNYESEIMSEKPEHRRQQTAGVEASAGKESINP